MEEPATAEGSLLDILQDPDVLDFGDIDDEVERLMAAELPPLLTFIEPLSSASSSMGTPNKHRLSGEAMLRISTGLSQSLNDCQDILAEILSPNLADLSFPFLFPADYSAFPDYANIVRRPVNLSVIKDKMDNGVYESPDAFAADMRTMFVNCYRWSGQSSDITRMGKKLQEMFELRFAAVAFETAVADLNHRKSGMDRSDIPSSPPPIVSEMSESDGLACDIENRPSLFVARLEARRQVLQIDRSLKKLSGKCDSVRVRRIRRYALKETAQCVQYSDSLIHPSSNPGGSRSTTSHKRGPRKQLSGSSETIRIKKTLPNSKQLQKVLPKRNCGGRITRSSRINPVGVQRDSYDADEEDNDA